MMTQEAAFFMYVWLRAGVDYTLVPVVVLVAALRIAYGLGLITLLVASMIIADGCGLLTGWG